MDFQRAALAIALGLLLLLIWQAWVEYETDKNLARQTTAGAEQDIPNAPAAPAISNDAGIPQAPAAPAASSAVPAVSQAVERVSTLETAQRIKVETDVFKVEIDTLGGDLRDARLHAYPVATDQPDTPFPLLKDTGPDLIVAQSGLIGQEDYPNHKTQYAARSLSYSLQDGSETLSVPLDWTSPDGIAYTKVYTFYRDSYLVDVEYRIANNSGQDWQGYMYGQFMSTEFVPDSEGFWIFRALPSYRGAAIYTAEDKYEKIDYGEIRDEDLSQQTDSGWVAMLQHYFVSAWLPQDNAPYRMYTRALGAGGAEPRYQAGYVALSPTAIAAGSTGTLSSRLYVGPKEQRRIKEPAEGLILTVDYGWLTPVSSPLFWILREIHNIVGNWGWSIIILTLMVKLVFYPLSAASYKSMAKMKKLQPRLKTLKERYGDDKQKMNQEMMSIYKKEKINPLGGCLPILIQIPVFIALYWVLLESVELRQAPFIFWLNDLSVKDPFYVLPVLMGASMFAQQFLNPTPLDAMQKNIMMSLPIVFTVFFLWFPAGLVLYWLVNNILSIAQQWYITRKLIPS